MAPKRTRSAILSETSQYNEEIKKREDARKPDSSFDSTYWQSSATIANLQAQRVEADKELDQFDLVQNETQKAQWEASVRGMQLIKEADLWVLDEEMSRAQEKRMKSDDGETKLSLQRSFMKYFVTSRRSLGISAAVSRIRRRHDQSRLRKKTIMRYGGATEDPLGFKHLWCPVFQVWIEKENFIAGHLFGYVHSQDTMNTIFGPQLDDNGNVSPEMVSPLNALLISKELEDVFDLGFRTIVPDIAGTDNPTFDQVRAWEQTKAKAYKIKILDNNHKLYNKAIRSDKNQHSTLKYWRDLEDRKLHFINENRPRARYMYWHHALKILRYSWALQTTNGCEALANDAMKTQLGRMYWGTIGNYLPDNLLLAMVEELGHNYNLLMGGVAGDSSIGQNDSTMRESLAQALSIAKTADEAAQETDDSDEEDEEEEDEDEAQG